MQTQTTSPTESAKQPEPSSPFLRGNFAPVPTETTHGELKVRGTLPREINGRLLRDGPNPVAPGPNYHWFTGDGMIHGVHLSDGKALGYRNRWVRTTALQELNGLAAAPVSPHPMLMQGSGNVNVIGHGGRILALPEIGLPYELDTDLATRRMYDFDGKLSSNMTAHPKIDGKTGELIFFGYDFGDVHLRYHVANAEGQLLRTEEIATPETTMMHDFSVTATRVIFMDLPVVFDPSMLEQGKSIPLRWSDEHQARLGVMPRDGGSADVQWINIDPCFVYHPLNAYDDGTRIIMDVVQHENTFIDGGLETPPSYAPRLVRWTIDTERGQVSSDIVYDQGEEFPRVNPRVECHPHRYGYAATVKEGFAFGDLLKHDMQTGSTQVHEVGAGRSATEGVFVPAGDGEDEGYVLSAVYDAGKNLSEVLVIDATDFTAPPVATIELPVRIPFGFHGNFVPE